MEIKINQCFGCGSIKLRKSGTVLAIWMRISPIENYILRYVNESILLKSIFGVIIIRNESCPRCRNRVNGSSGKS